MLKHCVVDVAMTIPFDDVTDCYVTSHSLIIQFIS